MVKGICFKCKRKVDTLFSTYIGYQCPRCQNIFCRECAVREGFPPTFICPDCGVQMFRDLKEKRLKEIEEEEKAREEGRLKARKEFVK